MLNATAAGWHGTSRLSKKFIVIAVGIFAFVAALYVLRYFAPAQTDVTPSAVTQTADSHLPAILFILGLYFIPSIVGRRKRNFTAIFWLNVLAGWTFVGWIVALVWALTKDLSSSVAVPAE